MGGALDRAKGKSKVREDQRHRRCQDQQTVYQELTDDENGEFLKRTDGQTDEQKDKWVAPWIEQKEKAKFARISGTAAVRISKRFIRSSPTMRTGNFSSGRTGKRMSKKTNGWRPGSSKRKKQSSRGSAAPPLSGSANGLSGAHRR